MTPFIPLLIGQGKLARHLSNYLTKKKIPFYHWPLSRKDQSRTLNHPEFKTLLTRASSAWILVSDRAISEIAKQVAELAPALTLLHSSAATDVPGALTLHPLQTFGESLYELPTYEQVPFVLVKEEWSQASELKKQIQGVFPNPIHEIAQKDRALYHAYCVMMANFPQLLWTEVTAESNQTLGEGLTLFVPILKQATLNFIEQGPKALTGPLVRGDQATIARHLDALSHSKLLPLYRNFVKLKETV